MTAIADLKMFMDSFQNTAKDSFGILTAVARQEAYEVLMSVSTRTLLKVRYWNQLKS